MNNLKITNKNNQLFVDSREIAEMVGKNHAHLLRDIKGYVEILTQSNFGFSEFFIENSYQDSTGRTLPCFLLTKKGCDMVANKMTGEKGVLFTAAYVTKFEQMEKELTLPKQPYQIQAFEMQLIGVDYTARILRVDDTSKIRMLTTAHEQHGVPTNHLPVYVDEEVTKSLSVLLKEYKVGMGAAKANTKLIELGLLEIKERPSSKGGTKEFKSLTEKGQVYGKNLLNPKNPKETQPHYLPSKFGKLAELLKS